MSDASFCSSCGSEQPPGPPGRLGDSNCLPPQGGSPGETGSGPAVIPYARANLPGWRFSRAAIVGAVWAGEALLAILWLSYLTGEPVPPWTQTSSVEKLGEIITEASFVLGALAILGTTALGWIARIQIRRAHGGLRGMPLAIFDALLFPLLALDGLLVWLCRTMAGHAVTQANPLIVARGAGSIAWVTVVAIAVGIDVLICRWVWARSK